MNSNGIATLSKRQDGCVPQYHIMRMNQANSLKRSFRKNEVNLQHVLEYYNEILYPINTFLLWTDTIMKRLDFVLAIAVLSLVSLSTHAQQDSSQMLTQGMDAGAENKYALRVLAPVSPTDAERRVIGGRMMLDDNTGIDLDLAFNYGSDNEDGVVKGLALSATAAYFQYIKKGRVSPYYKALVNFGVFTDDKKGNDDITLGAGLGAEFFIIPEFSLFAEAGLGIAFSPFAIDTVSTQAGIAFYF